MRERVRACVEFDRAPHGRGLPTRALLRHPPPGCAHEEPVDRQAVGVSVHATTAEIDLDPPDPEATPGKAIRPRREEREPERVAAAQRGRPTGRRQELLPAASQRDTGHAEAGEEHRVGAAGVERERRLAVPSRLVNGGARGHASTLDRARTRETDCAIDAPAPSDLRGDPRAPVVITLLIAIVIPLVMPHEFSPGRGYAVASVEGILLVAMLAMDPGRIDARSAKVRGVRIALFCVLVVGAAWATVALIVDIADGGSNTNSAGELLLAGASFFTYIAIEFAFMYW